ALIGHPRIAKVVLMAQQPDLLTRDPQTAWLVGHDNILLQQSGAGISQSLLDYLGKGENAFPLLVTTADNVLLDTAMIDAFVVGAGGADIAAAMVERGTMQASYPDSRRTWLKFRGGSWSGANLFWLGSEQAARALEKWRDVEQDRKKGWKIVAAFGPVLLLGALLRLLTIHQAIARAGRKLGAAARIVPMPMAEACIDADKPEDIELIEKILSRRAP
ncbi:MAG: 4-diphosphocytidyl-2C-methyl-D-erythritol synthase, partial [Sphingobium sp.]